LIPIASALLPPRDRVVETEIDVTALWPLPTFVKPLVPSSKPQVFTWQ
jgi:hypothetical protein